MGELLPQVAEAARGTRRLGAGGGEGPALCWVRHGESGAPMPRLALVPYRPNRVEPRALKPRPKEYDRLNRPRQQMRKRLMGRRRAAFQRH